MFIGHFGVGLAAKKLDSSISLGILFIAAQIADLLWPVLLLLDVEHVRIIPGYSGITPFDFYDYPISHSLVTAILISAGAGALYYAFRKSIKACLVREGEVVRKDIVRCKAHDWEYEIKTGKCLTNDYSDLRQFKVYIQDGIVYLDREEIINDPDYNNF